MGANLPDIKTFVEAGLDPKTHLPKRIGDSSKQKEEIKKFFRIMDEQDAVNRFRWFNLPASISSQELERLLYYKGQLCFFYLTETEDFYFMPYALEGSLDFYGRYNNIHPVPVMSGTEDKDLKKAYDRQRDFLSTINLKVIHDVVIDDISVDLLSKSTVLLSDYTKQLGQTIIPRAIVNDCIIDQMADILPYLNTALLAGTGIKGVRVQDADSGADVVDGARSLKRAALNQELYVPILSTIKLEDLADGSLANPEQYMMTLQSLDNIRLSGYGLENGGIFEKQAHILESENAMNNATVSLVMQDGLAIRQHFCNIVNSIWDLNIWCEPCQSVLGVDIDGDGRAYDGENVDSDFGVWGVDVEGGEEDDSTI